jgi:hypothetical protein
MYYATQSPRGFRNEVNVLGFCSPACRTAYCAESERRADVESALKAAHACTRRAADRRLASNRKAARDHARSAAYADNYGSSELPTVCAQCGQAAGA